ncbi:hypothetical protein ACWGJW_19050 [Streptomyces nigrescens]
MGDGATRAGGGNTALAVLIKEAGCSNAALARRVNDLGSLQGEITRYDKASVTRWVQGMTPKGKSPQFIAEAIGGFLGRSVSPTDLGFPQQALRPVVARALTYCEDVGETLHTLAELGSTDISRRSLLGARSSRAPSWTRNDSGSCGSLRTSRLPTLPLWQGAAPSSKSKR